MNKYKNKNKNLILHIEGTKKTFRRTKIQPGCFHWKQPQSNTTKMLNNQLTYQ